jgi:4-diphosphocytidyl-2-C-methyl-D-erythritol kinase
MDMLVLRSPAKINLFLRILGRRADNYHELASLFQTIDLFDILTLTLCSSSDRLSCTDPTIPLDETNLVSKGIELFRKKTHLKFYLNVHIEKNIPQQAGLGGGSSNAATILWGLNELLQKPATMQQLMKWGGEIGSDVSFFLSQGTAYCTGRGEVIQPIAQLKNQKLVIVKPKEGLSTPLVYKNVKLEKIPHWDPYSALQVVSEGKSFYKNDLEISAFEIMPSLLNLKNELVKSGFDNVLMSGSGTAFFCTGKSSGIDKNHFSHQAQFINRSKEAWF